MIVTMSSNRLADVTDDIYVIASLCSFNKHISSVCLQAEMCSYFFKFEEFFYWL